MAPVGRFPPDSTVSAAAQRALMAGSVPRAAARRDPTSRAIASALRGAALGWLGPAEREWIERIERRRRELVSGEALAALAGAPSGDWTTSSTRTIRALRDGCRWTTMPPVWGRFLMRLIRELAPRSCLELGTGFGFSAAYQAAALELNGAGRLITLEAQPGAAEVAVQGLFALGLSEQVEVRIGPIAETLDEALESSSPVDYVLADADHTEEATMEHFAAMLPHVLPGSVVVFDDINWTEGMRRAWHAIARHRSVSRALGLGRVGVAVIAAPRA